MTQYTTDELEEKRAEFKKDFINLFQSLLDLSQGRIYREEFYNLLSQTRYLGGTLSHIKIQEKLQSAWWIEEEDVKQHLLLIIWRRSLTSKSYLRIKTILYWELRDYLLKQKLFSRQAGWDNDYIEYYQDILEINNENRYNYSFLAVVLDSDLIFSGISRLSIFNKYMIYLTYILELERKDISKVLLIQTRQVNRLQVALKKQLEDFYG